MDRQSAKSIPYLDGWRGVAILLVLYSHFFVGAGGDLGVTLFFVLSGFLVSDLLFQRQSGIATFFWRRATRILPTFWLYLAVMGWYTATLQPVPYAVPADEMAATLTFLRTYLPSDRSIWSDQWPIGHLWSLNVEEHAYLALGLVAVVLRATGARLLLRAVMLASVGVMCLVIAHYSRTPPAGASPWILRTECAALGLMASAWIHASRPLATRPLLRNGHWAITPVALGAGLLCYLPGAPYLAAPGLAPLLLAVAVNYLDSAPALFLRALCFTPLRWFGLCSYSLYMWQQPFYKLLAVHDLPRGAALVLALAVGTGAYYLFENPVRRYLNQAWWLRRRHPARSA